MLCEVCGLEMRVLRMEAERRELVLCCRNPRCAAYRAERRVSYQALHEAAERSLRRSFATEGKGEKA